MMWDASLSPTHTHTAHLSVTLKWRVPQSPHSPEHGVGSFNQTVGSACGCTSQRPTLSFPFPATELNISVPAAETMSAAKVGPKLQLFCQSTELEVDSLRMSVAIIISLSTVLLAEQKARRVTMQGLI